MADNYDLEILGRIIDYTIVTDSGCWQWTRSTGPGGYPQLSYRGTVVRAHKKLWEILLGDVPEFIYVLHACHNKLCCNPLHLHLGGQTANKLDDRLALRNFRKLDAKKVRLIKALWAAKRVDVVDKRFALQVAPLFNVNFATILRIKANTATYSEVLL